MRTVRSLAAVASLLVLAPGCKNGLIGDADKPSVGPTETSDAGEADGGDLSVLTACSSTPAATTLDGVAELFAKDVHPLMDRPAGRCLSCHGQASGRNMIVPTSGAKDVFYRLRGDGFLKRDKPGALRDRLVNPDPKAHMPQGGPYWTAGEVKAVDDVLCALEAYEKQVVEAPPDETFPKELESPWTGAPSTLYDNTFINDVQLKGKVKSVFNEAWVRGGTDLFQKNIGLFGGVDFKTTFIEARTATPEFLLGLDNLAKDVCHDAAFNKTGPFAGLDTVKPLRDTPPPTTTQLEAETMATHSVGAAAPPGWILWSNGYLLDSVTFSSGGQPATYEIKVRAKGNFVDNAWSMMDVKIGGKIVQSVQVASDVYATYTMTATIADGPQTVAAYFTNDFYMTGVGDRNLWVDWITITGPLGTPTNGANEQAARSNLRQLYRRMLYRPVTPAEETDVYKLLLDVQQIDASASLPNAVPDAWASVCEALMKSPDFLFTLPPSFGTTTVASEKKTLWLVKLAQDLVGRPPTAAEFAMLETKTLDELVTFYFAQPEFKDFYYHRVRIRLESDGTVEADEPARLWTWLMLNDRSFADLMVADYTVDPSWQQQSRPAQHGTTGVLTMKGYLKNKPGLPHYNYAARVLTDFMGYVFEVPPQVFDMRDTATAATTVDPKSICFGCHQLLTPLSHQRLAWGDDGAFRTVDSAGKPIDDSDRGLVDIYPYKGKGLASFTTIAIRKERFVRHTLNSQFNLFFGRPMRHTEDERGLYKALWDITATSHGKLKDVIRAVVLSDAYKRGI